VCPYARRRVCAVMCVICVCARAWLSRLRLHVGGVCVRVRLYVCAKCAYPASPPWPLPGGGGGKGRRAKGGLQPSAHAPRRRSKLLAPRGEGEKESTLKVSRLHTTHPPLPRISHQSLTATHCNTLQHSATYSITLQHTANPPTLAPAQPSITRCNTIQHTATQCNTLQHMTTLQHTAKPTLPSPRSAIHQSLPFIATHCNILQHTSTYGITLQHTANPTLPSPRPAIHQLLPSIAKHCNMRKHTTTIIL